MGIPACLRVKEILFSTPDDFVDFRPESPGVSHRLEWIFVME